MPKTHSATGIALTERIHKIARMITVKVWFRLALVDQFLKLLLSQVIANVFIEMRIGVIFPQFKMIVSFRNKRANAVCTAVQIMHAGYILLVLVDTILDVLLRLGHNTIVVPAELWRIGRFV